MEQFTAVAGGIAAAITTPFDCVKTVLNTQQTPRFDTTCRLLTESGHTAYYKYFFFKFSLKFIFVILHASLSWNFYPCLCSHLCFRFHKVLYRGLADGIRTIYYLRGTSGFFRGLQARIIFQVPSTALSWSAYELCKYILSVRSWFQY